MSDRREHGDRAAFLARVRDRLSGGIPVNAVHRPPTESGGVPEIVHLGLDRADLEGSFVRAATMMGATVHASGAVHDTVSEAVASIVAAHSVRTAVVTSEVETGVVDALRANGVEVRPYDPVTAASADLGVTGTVAAVAATGSVAVDSDVAGSRGASLVPPVHLCVVPRGRLVATPGDVLRRYNAEPERLPANLVLITGPSRTGDIEQLLTVGVHGPIAVHCLLVD